jgi:hypothetical protein
MRDAYQSTTHGWRARHRRLWQFVVFAPYLALLPLVPLVVPLGLSRTTEQALAITSLVLILGYLVVGLVAGWRVYGQARRELKDFSESDPSDG